MMKNKKLLTWGILLLLSLCFTLSAFAQPPAPEEKQVLFIGNSLTYTHNLPEMLEKIATSKGRKITCAQFTAPGVSLKQNWDAKAAATIASQKWDYVVLQEYGGNYAVTQQADFNLYVQKLHNEIKAISAQTILYLIYNTKSDPKESAKNQYPLTVAYAQAAREIGALVAPVGPAWVKVAHQDPGLVLYDSDKIHPTPLGAYLSACVFYAVIFQESPAGADAKFLKDPVPDPKTILLVQNTAWETATGWQTGLE